MKRDNMLIEVDELLTRLDEPNIRIYDATILFFRKESEQTAHEEYLQSHIPGTAFFDHEKFSDASNEYMYMVLPEADLATQIGNIGIDEDSEVVFYTSGYLPCATRAWWILHYAGHNNVRVLNGGLAAWEKAGGKIEQGARQYESSNFECRLRPNMFASKEEVQAAMEDGGVCTEYTLTSAMYGGVHIPGSSLIPCDELMQGMASFVPDDAIASRLKEEAQHERVITYCGGGIAATVNGMAHLMAGNENVAVYDGSLSEWMGEGLPTTVGDS
ncbi:Thiosulfate sulfurtransferase, rhodanese [hydrothermal vent metagenome]|uniref:Thiosulfate sulfurtransferase, rhodanese n=1 Tax=hydrothermal vent metagenome TaxID=652676 RepID=A0A3B0W185_9ZZZZ